MLLSAAVLLVVSASAAEVASDAAAPSPPQFDVFPAAGTTLPENGRLLLAATERVLVTHDDGRVEDLVPGEPFIYALTTDYGTVVPTLTAGEVVSLEAICQTCAGLEPLSWPVGAADVDAPVFQGEPAFVDVYAVSDTPITPRSGFAVSFSVPPRLQADEPVVLEVAGEDVGFRQLSSSPETTVDFFVSGGDERQACFTVTATDLAGNVSEPHDVCIDLVDDSPGPFGCSQASASSTAVFAVAALLLRRRRRLVQGG